MTSSSFVVAVALILTPVAAQATQGGRINEMGRRHFGPPPSSPGPHTMLAEPQLRDRETGGRNVAVAPDAILARESYVVAAARMATSAPVSLGPPFSINLPAGTVVVVRSGEADQARCLVIDAPLHDAGGSYSDACLVDRDGDGRFETLHLLGEDKAPSRDVAIAPLALQPMPPAADPRLTWFLVQRRLRVARIDNDRAGILVESSIDPGGEGGLGWRAIAAPGLVGWLRLREGETVRLGGLRLTVHAGPTGGWQIATDGEFAPWLVLRDHDSMVDTGEGTMQAD